MIIFVDIDNTICKTTNNDPIGFTDYLNAIPSYKRIAQINKLYDKGNKIIYWTGRGTLSNKTYELFQITLNQLNQWGCKYHELRLGKPIYDLFIDDKNINDKAFFDHPL